MVKSEPDITKRILRFHTTTRDQLPTTVLIKHPVSWHLLLVSTGMGEGCQLVTSAALRFTSCLLVQL